jgi:hypothetical protein
MLPSGAEQNFDARVLASVAHLLELLSWHIEMEFGDLPITSRKYMPPCCAKVSKAAEDVRTGRIPAPPSIPSFGSSAVTFDADNERQQLILSLVHRLNSRVAWENHLEI